LTGVVGAGVIRHEKLSKSVGPQADRQWIVNVFFFVLFLLIIIDAQLPESISTNRPYFTVYCDKNAVISAGAEDVSKRLCRPIR